MNRILQELNEKAKDFTLPIEILESSEDGRLSFIDKFPLDQLDKLSIDEFVQGTDDNSFCYWLEFKNIGFGIGGGNASKFGIYKTTKDGETFYVIGSGKYKKLLTLNDAESYYSSLLNNIILALQYVDNNQIERIKDLEIPMWNMVLQKILSIYYPDKFLNIGASNVLIKCAQELMINGIELQPDNLIQINFECKKVLRNIAEYKDWSNEKIGWFIWENFKEDKSTSKAKTQYWLYSPGENASKWDEFYDAGIIALGWDKLGDLTQYKSRGEIKKALISSYGGEGDKKNDVSANDDFLNKLKKGDIIISKKGRSELLGYGIVTSDYYFDENRIDFKSCRKIRWELKGNWKVRFNLVLKTLTDITKYPTEDPDYDKYYERLLGIMKKSSSSATTKTTFPLNTIFYGPPGTGKTYNTILRAAQIIENRSDISYDDALEIFKANLRDRIEFITFHQNYSYEDFIQGLRPETDNKSSLVFEKKDGIFKKIADKALENIKLAEKAPSELSYEARFNLALEKFQEVILENEDNYPINDTAYIFEVEEEAFRYTGDKWTNHTNGLRMKYSDLREFYRHNVQNRKDVKKLTTISGLANQHATYYFLVYQEIIKHLPQKFESPEKIRIQNYVLIIDEINRANISRVFGELITLIEPDKRYNAKLSIEARLPSGDSFTVPSNLYIIGTMNTADKSIALLDIALRRRFEFESMYPRYDIEEHQIYDVEVLKKLNEEIVRRKSHDFQIGHSYFMGEHNDLEERMNNKVIPLLLEYFMNDENEVKGILRSAGLTIKEESWPIRIEGRND